VKLHKKIECEAKIKVYDLETLVRKITALGWKWKGVDSEINEIYALKNGRGFRLRKIDGEKKILYTHKGENLPSQYKKKPESECELSPEQAKKLLKHATYIGKYEKRRITYKAAKDCIVALDEVMSLGDYIEVEAPDDEKVTDILLLLGLNPEDHINESYFALLQKKYEKDHHK